MPYSDEEKQKEYMKNLMRKRRELKKEEFLEKNFGIKDDERPKDDEFPEHAPFGYERPQKRSIESALNPVSARRGKSDSPESYGMTGTLICSTCGTPLDKDGKCPICDREPSQTDVDYQRSLS
jgi:rubrerythrin